VTNCRAGLYVTNCRNLKTDPSRLGAVAKASRGKYRLLFRTPA